MTDHQKENNAKELGYYFDIIEKKRLHRERAL